MLGLCSLLYSVALYASTLQADLFEVTNPWWIVTSATVLLLSPLYHAVIIPAIARARGFEVSITPSFVLERFPNLFLGQLLVNLGVVLGSMLFVVPGVLIGLRTIYYKQELLLAGGAIRDAILSSLKRTGLGKRLLEIFAALAIFYCLPLGMEFFVLPLLGSLAQHITSILATALFVGWLNAYITDSYLASIARDTESDVL